jgi:hypothetical protein
VAGTGKFLTRVLTLYTLLDEAGRTARSPAGWPTIEPGGVTVLQESASRSAAAEIVRERIPVARKTRSTAIDRARFGRCRGVTRTRPNAESPTPGRQLMEPPKPRRGGPQER